MAEEKKIKLTFAPGCFDEFDGTQEELDEMIAQITQIFTEATPEEIEAMSRPLSEVIDELDEQELDAILNSVDLEKTERKLH